MTFDELQAQLSLGGDRPRRFKEDIRITTPTITTPTQGTLRPSRLINPYHSLGSGINRALLHNDESGNLHVTPYRREGGFTATIRRKSSLAKTANQIVETILDNPSTTIPDLAESLKVTERAIVPGRHRRHPKAKQIKALRESNINRRIGSAKGGHWEVLGG